MNALAQINTLYLFLFIITKVGTEKHLAQIETIVQIRRQQPLIQECSLYNHILLFSPENCAFNET